MRISHLIPIAAITLACLLPLSASAQVATDMRETIRASLLSDPRTAGMSEAELDAMVELLAAEAVEEGVTAEDIVWRPQAEVVPSVSDDACTLTPRFLCSLNQAFGFDGSATLIPLLLGVTSMLLIVFFGYELERHYMRARALKRAAASGEPLA